MALIEFLFELEHKNCIKKQLNCVFTKIMSSTPAIVIWTVSCIGPTVIGVSVSGIPVSPLAAINPYKKHLIRRHNYI